MIEMRVKLTGAEAARAGAKAIAAGVRDLSVPLRAFGAHLVASVQRNFELGGRPRWIPSRKIAGFTARHRPATRSPKTLINRGTLKNSIQVEAVAPRLVRVGTNTAYAHVHQEGFQGPAQIGPYLRRVRARDVHGIYAHTVKRGPNKGKVVQRKGIIAQGFCRVGPHTRQMHIPPRPFLVVQAEDERTWWQLLEEYLRKLVG
jgi:phage gpG-like protein